MSILKAMQKFSEQQGGETENPAPATVVPFNKNARRANLPPDLFLDKALRIGTPVSVSNGQAETSTGMALPGVMTTVAAGATLDTVESTRLAAPKKLPEFASWSIEVERVEPRLVAITQPYSSYCEEYRSLRTHVLQKSQKRGIKSIVVASVNASEGKSVTSLNLAWLLAQTDGLRCLVIDSDLRNPSLTDYLGIETDSGLSDVLAGRQALKDSIIKLEPAGLHLLPGGEARSDVAELLSGPKFKDILLEARDMFDYVIVDAPPLAIFTDATVLINDTDAALLVLKANKTRYAAVDRVLESLPRERFLGVVLNQSKDEMKESHYHYGYYYRRRSEANPAG